MTKYPLTFTMLATLALLCSPMASAEEIEVFRSGPPAKDAADSSFGSESVVRIEPAKDKPLLLHLRDLPEHQFLKIDAVVDINQMGNSGFGAIRIVGGLGGGGKAGDDSKDIRGRLQVAVDGATPVLDASFGGQIGNAIGGSFPDHHGDFLHLPGTGSANGPVEVKGKGGRVRIGGAGGKVAEKLKEHHLTFVIPHTGKEAELEFQWVKPGGAKVGGAVIAIAGLGGSPSAPFSIKDITASVIDAPMTLDPGTFAQRYSALGAESPTDAMAALNDLISAGRGVLPMLRDELHKKGDPDLEKKFGDALEAMDNPSFEVRAGAAKSLSALGQDVVPLARRKLAEEGDALSIEVKKTLENLADSIEKGTGAVAENSRANRLHRLLDTLGGDEAEKLRGSLPKRQLVVDPALAPAIQSSNATPGVIEMDFGGIKGVDGGGGAVFKFEGKVGGVKIAPAPAPPKEPEVEAEK